LVARPPLTDDLFRFSVLFWERPPARGGGAARRKNDVDWEIGKAFARVREGLKKQYDIENLSATGTIGYYKNR
jgi:hypothetical protein